MGFSCRCSSSRCSRVQPLLRYTCALPQHTSPKCEFHRKPATGGICTESCAVRSFRFQQLRKLRAESLPAGAALHALPADQISDQRAMVVTNVLSTMWDLCENFDKAVD